MDYSDDARYLNKKKVYHNKFLIEIHKNYE